jgi:hypothetical protein
MARLSDSNERGAVYVEFLIAFFPIFLIFLAVCQLALVAAAETIVRHSAFAAVRSAIVVLEASPDQFDGAPRGNLSQGQPRVVPGAEEVLGKLGFTVETTVEATTKLPQVGARMVPIQTAALVPLLPLAPRADPATDSVMASIVAATKNQLPFALKYSRAATRVTLHDAPDDASLANEPIKANANVTVRVSYLFHCTVPLVRVLMCRGFDAVTTANPDYPMEQLKQLVGTDDRFKLLSAEATLPNQGAAYYDREHS